MSLRYRASSFAHMYRAVFSGALAGGILLGVSGHVWAVDCVNTPETSWLETSNDPPAEDERAIIKLIHRYNWVLDGQNSGRLTDLFSRSVFYELCNAANEQLTQKNGDSQLQIYLDDYFVLLRDKGTQTRHIASNTLLHAVNANTIQAKTTVVVTLQHSDIETPVLDYTGVLRSEFEKSANVWRFSKMTLIIDGPQLTLRAR